MPINVNMPTSRFGLVYENVKRKILESQQQHWEALAEYWHWYLWHRDSDFSGNVFMVDPQSSSVSLSCTSASPMAVIQHEAQALTFNSCSKVQYPLNEPQGPIRYYAGDCYNTDRHGTMIKDMSLFQSHTEKGGASGAMLNKDIRKHQGQGSTEPRPISEPLLAREPTLISDRADGHHRLLDSVMDNATTLTESSSRHQYQSGDENRPTLAESLPTKTIRQLSITSSSATRQPSTRIHNSKAKFFVCEDDSEEDEEAEQEQDDQYFNAPSFIKVRSSMELIGFCHSDFQVFKQPDQNDYDLDDYEQDQDQDQDTDEEDYFEKRVSAPIPSGGAPEMGRRHSLLSDLFMAEKLLVAQSASSSKAGNSNTTTTRAQPRLYPSPPLHRYNNASSEGDDPFRVAVNPQQLNQSTHLEALSTCQTLVGLAHQSIQSNHHQYQNFGDRIFTQAELTLPKAKTCQERTPESPLKRTKKSMFKNLDELAVDLITEYQENNILDSSIPQSPHPESTSTNSAIASETYTCKTNLVTLSPALTPTSSTSTSPLNASSKKPPPHSTLPSPAKTCRCSPATATTKTAFATVSATSKCIAPASSVFSAVSVAAAVAATAGVGEDNYGWNQVYNLQTHLQSICENLSSSIQRAISTPSST
ncbi:hypothetical protein BGX27_011473 [Mortierella sp. AM989]|nr:hypothetical protein BGX27_011473 [Mortierella sp. AM989]